jgi:hypothetical protein
MRTITSDQRSSHSFPLCSKYFSSFTAVWFTLWMCEFGPYRVFAGPTQLRMRLCESVHIIRKSIFGEFLRRFYVIKRSSFGSSVYRILKIIWQLSIFLCHTVIQFYRLNTFEHSLTASTPIINSTGALTYETFINKHFQFVIIIKITPFLPLLRCWHIIYLAFPSLFHALGA